MSALCLDPCEIGQSADLSLNSRISLLYSVGENLEHMETPSKSSAFPIGNFCVINDVLISIDKLH